MRPKKSIRKQRSGCLGGPSKKSGLATSRCLRRVHRPPVRNLVVGFVTPYANPDGRAMVYKSAQSASRGCQLGTVIGALQGPFDITKTSRCPVFLWSISSVCGIHSTDTHWAPRPWSWFLIAFLQAFSWRLNVSPDESGRFCPGVEGWASSAGAHALAIVPWTSSVEFGGCCLG